MTKKTELRVELEGHEVDTLNDFMHAIGQKNWTATVRYWLASLRTPARLEKRRSPSSSGGSIQ